MTRIDTLPSNSFGRWMTNGLWSRCVDSTAESLPPMRTLPPTPLTCDTLPPIRLPVMTCDEPRESTLDFLNSTLATLGRQNRRRTLKGWSLTIWPSSGSRSYLTLGSPSAAEYSTATRPVEQNSSMFTEFPYTHTPLTLSSIEHMIAYFLTKNNIYIDLSNALYLILHQRL